MRDINKFFGIGRLTADPELKQVSDEIALCTFAIAMNRTEGEKKEERVTFLNVTTWRRLAEVCSRYLSKGNRVAVLGWLKSSEYMGQDEVQKKRLEVVAESVQFLEAARQESSSCPAGRYLF
ncbi:MAG: single-stranded DNA-binding protein, partial [bacterium]|nr:single-stranded DNA-binding protein [bacterium]